MISGYEERIQIHVARCVRYNESDKVSSVKISELNDISEILLKMTLNIHNPQVRVLCILVLSQEAKYPFNDFTIPVYHT